MQTLMINGGFIMLKNNDKKMNAIANRIEVLESMLNQGNVNNQRILEQLINEFSILEHNTDKEDEKSIYKNIIDGCKEVADNHINMRYNPIIYYNMINEKLHHKMISQYLIYDDEFERSSRVHILTDYKMTDEDYLKTENMDRKLEFYKNLIGKKEVFIQYSGDLDSPSFMDFEDYATENALCIRMIQTETGRPIYYYGGENYEKVLEVIDKIDEDTRKNGLYFDIKRYQLSK